MHPSLMQRFFPSAYLQCCGGRLSPWRSVSSQPPGLWRAGVDGHWPVPQRTGESASASAV